MATPEDITALRNMIGEPDNVAPYTDDVLGLIIDSALNLQDAASHIWSRKAADSALLVDISENGSSRKMSDVHKNALAMARMYRSESDELVAVVSRAPRTRPIVRP